MPESDHKGDAMTVREIKLNLRNDGVPDALDRLRHWVHAAPLDIALRHKRHGQWQAWRWIDVLRDVEQLVDGLRQHDFDQRSRLLLSGAFDPDFLLLALAAQASGASIVIAPTPHSVEQARAQTEAQRPTHSFVQQRRDLPLWLDAAEHSRVLRTLICGQVPLLESASTVVTSVAQLRVKSDIAPERQAHKRGAALKQLWSEEGSDWQGGFAVLLQQWLGSGQALAFAECTGSVARDRRDAAPTGLVLSASRLLALADEIESRLPPSGTWRRRLCDWAIAESSPANARQGLRGVVRNRVRQLLGFGNLSYIWQAATQSTAAHPWVAPQLKDAA